MGQVTSKIKNRFINFWWGDQGISFFLLLLFASMFLAPFFDSVLLQSVAALLFSLLLISGVSYLSPRPLLRWAAGLVAFTTIILHWLQEFRPDPELAIAASLFSLFSVASLTLVMLIRVFSNQAEGTSSRVRGAVAAYILFGITWSILYQLINACLPEAFSPSATAGLTAADQRESFTYFSFVTLTTLGYGDITAIHPIARMFVIFEGLIGQLYPATLLARLVSLEISNRQSQPHAVPAGTPDSLAAQKHPPDTDSVS